MLVPKVTLQGEVGTTRSFVINHRFERFRAMVPRSVSVKLAERLRKMRGPDGKALFTVEDIRREVPKGAAKDPVIKNSCGEVQHVDGSDRVDWYQKEFSICH